MLLQAERQLSETDRSLVEIFGSRLSIAFDNVILYQQLQRGQHPARGPRRAAHPRADAGQPPAVGAMAAAAARQRLQERNSRHRRPRPEESARRHSWPHRNADRTDRRRLLRAKTSRSQVDHIRDATKRLTSMVDHLISDAMADAFDITIRREPVDIAALVGEVADANQPLAVNKQQSITVSAAPNLTATCDADRMREAIDNLISNAIKYSPIGGKISVQVGQEANKTADPRRRPGRRSFAGRPRPAVRTLPAVVRQAHGRREFDRPRSFDRQAHHRHAWRRGRRQQCRAWTRLDIHHHIARSRRVIP